MTTATRAVLYLRMSSSPQEKSVPQQRAEMAPRCQLAGVVPVAEFVDEAKSGGGMGKRDAFLEMLTYCQAAAEKGEPVEAIACYDTSRFSRATSMETAHYIWEFQRVGVHRVLTWERWFDFRKEEDRAIFLIQQDFTNNRYLRDLSARVLRGKKDAAQAGYFTGGMVPFGFDRLMLDDRGKVVQRFQRGEQVRIRKQGWREVLAPIPEDDTDVGRQLERQTVVWLFETFAATEVSYSSLASQLNAKGVPGPGAGYKRRAPSKGQALWTVGAVKGILTNPVYCGIYEVGTEGKGAYHRLVQGQVVPTRAGDRRTDNQDGTITSRLEHGGIVGEALWQAVQEKAKGRRRECRLVRSRGYLLPSGLLHCGHCGGRMYGCTMKPKRGTKQYVYRKYVCATATIKPGGCKRHSINEDAIVNALVNKLLNVYLDAERLEGLKQALLKKVQTKQAKVPAALQRLRARLAELDTEVTTARRRVLQAKDDVTFGELNEGLKEMLAERDRVQRQAAAAERDQKAPTDDATARVEKALAELDGLRETLKKAATERTRAALGAVLRRLITRVDLFFEPQEVGNRRWFSFVRGVIKLQPLLDVSGSLGDAK